MIKKIGNDFIAYGDGREILGKFKLKSQAVKAYSDYKHAKLSGGELEISESKETAHA